MLKIFKKSGFIAAFLICSLISATAVAQENSNEGSVHGYYQIDAQ
jgi:hypothetical protein